MSAPTDLHDDLPPAFPEWLKRRIPLLRAEETNVLFQIFRRRRELYPPSGVAKYVRHVYTLRTIFWGLSIPLLVFAFIVPAPYSRYALIAWFTLLTIVILTGILARVGTRNDSALPTTVTEVFGQHSIAKQAALDLWMTGFRGGDVLQAIYLEAVGARWKATLVASVILSFSPYALIYPRDGFGNPFMFVFAIFATSGAGYSFWRMTMVESHSATVRRDLESRISLWRNAPWDEQLFTKVVGIGMSIGLIVVSVLGMYFLLWLNELVSVSLTYPTFFDYDLRQVRPFLAENEHLSRAILVSLEVGLLCWIVAIVRRSFVSDSIAAAFRNADAPFELYATRVICKDTTSTPARLGEK